MDNNTVSLNFKIKALYLTYQQLLEYWIRALTEAIKEFWRQLVFWWGHRGDAPGNRPKKLKRPKLQIFYKNSPTVSQREFHFPILNTIWKTTSESSASWSANHVYRRHHHYIIGFSYRRHHHYITGFSYRRHHHYITGFSFIRHHHYITGFLREGKAAYVCVCVCVCVWGKYYTVEPL